MEKIKCSREIPVRRDVDVFVAGGGPAGVAAAVTAARAGRVRRLLLSMAEAPSEAWVRSASYLHSCRLEMGKDF